MATAQQLMTEPLNDRCRIPMLGRDRLLGRAWLLGAGCLLGVCSGFGLLTIEHLSNLWVRPHYQFFPFLIAAVLYLAYRRWPQVSSPSRNERWWGCLAVVLCALSQATAVWLGSPWLSMVNGIWLMCAWCVMTHGWRLFVVVSPVWMLLWLLVPLPLKLDAILINAMQTVSVHVASGVADLCGRNHLVQGHVIHIPGQLLLVDEACSGVQSLLATLAMVAVFAVGARRPLVVSGLLLASTFLWVGVVNVTRIVIIVLVNSQTSWDLSCGWRHDVLTMLLFPLTVLLLLATDRMLRNLLAPVDCGDARLACIWDRIVTFPTVTFPTVNSPARLAPDSADRRACGVGRLVGGVMLLLGIWGVVLQASRSVETTANSAAGGLVVSLQRGSMPDALQGWTQTGFEAQGRTITGGGGTHTHTWNYQLDRQTAAISFDYPFRGWHPLEVCYEARGWHVSRKITHGAPLGCWVECLLQKPSGEFAVLCYRMYQNDGRGVECPGATLRATLGTRFADVLSPQARPSDNCQFQMFIRLISQPTANELQAIRAGYQEFSNVIHGTVFGSEVGFDE